MWVSQSSFSRLEISIFSPRTKVALNSSFRMDSYKLVISVRSDKSPLLHVLFHYRNLPISFTQINLGEVVALPQTLEQVLGSLHWLRIGNSYFKVNLHSIRFSYVFVRFFTFLLLLDKVCAFSSAFLCVHIRTNQTVTYWAKVF